MIQTIDTIIISLVFRTGMDLFRSKGRLQELTCSFGPCTFGNVLQVCFEMISFSSSSKVTFDSKLLWNKKIKKGWKWNIYGSLIQGINSEVKEHIRGVI